MRQDEMYSAINTDVFDTDVFDEVLDQWVTELKFAVLRSGLRAARLVEDDIMLTG
jgi:hypothetical protein